MLSGKPILIANPIYDVVFKRLMENEKAAKFFISTLINKTVEEIHLKPQEFTYDLPSGVAIFRLDFIATIRTDKGTYEKMIEELKKRLDKSG